MAIEDALYKTCAGNGEEQRKWTELQKRNATVIDNGSVEFTSFRIDGSRKKWASRRDTRIRRF